MGHKGIFMYIYIYISRVIYVPGSETCLIWKWIDLMLQEIEDSAKWQELPSFVNYEILREEVRKNRSIIEEAKFPVTLTHGDLKPSNIMILEDNSVNQSASYC